MGKTLSLLVIGLLGLALVSADAEARRMGGGRNLGKQMPNYSRQATRPPAAAPTAPAPPRTPSPGASRWLGPLAGLAAGGLLASLFFGETFQGLQAFDLLLLGALAVAAFLLFRALRRRAPVPSAQRYAAAQGGFSRPEMDVDSGPTQTGSGSSRAGYPSWFDEGEFLKGAKTHFIRLQAAWDRGDMNEIQGYATPELFAELKADRESAGGATNFTDVVSLNAELLGFVQDDDAWVASVRYNGLIREAQDATPQEFVEVWHVQRAVDDPAANWYVAGIQQL